MKKYYFYFTAYINLLLLSSVAFPSSLPIAAIHVSSDFESGSIGQVSQVSPTELRLSLRNDNDALYLPPEMRDWWYVKLENVPTDQPINIQIRNRGHHFFYVPVYSYDQKTWFHLDEKNVKQSPACIWWVGYCYLTMQQQFESDTVYLARFYPYTFTTLQNYLEEIEQSPFVKRETIGHTAKMDLPIELLTISDFTIADKDKKRIWIQARTHPGETGSSYLLEGLVNYLLSDQANVQEIRENFIFNIIPMHNPEGVIAGNYQLNLEGVDLERGWIYDPEDPIVLSPQAPLENQFLNSIMRQWLYLIESPAVGIALNLHATNESPDQEIFFFPHFGNIPSLYNQQQRSLYMQQVRLIGLVERYYHALYEGHIATPSKDGGDEFLEEYFPERWWWENRQDKVVAMTLETVYGTAGFDHWITQDDLRHLGRILPEAMSCYYSVHCPSPGISSIDLPLRPKSGS